MLRMGSHVSLVTPNDVGDEMLDAGAAAPIIDVPLKEGGMKQSNLD